MIILAFSTSTDHGSVAVVGKDKLLGQLKWSRQSGQTQNSDALILKIQNVLKKLKIKPEKLTAVAVDKGPGSFTGCRIAVNVAKTFGYTLGIPVIAFSSLDVLAHHLDIKKKGTSLKRKTSKEYQPSSHYPFLTVMDAHKSLVYCCWYVVKEGEILPRSSVEARPLEDFTNLISDKTLVYGICPPLFHEEFQKKGAKVQVGYPEAKIIGVLARSILLKSNFQGPEGNFSWKNVEPSYIRAPEAVEKLQRK